MAENKNRKSIAPQEEGDLPNEKRCKNCWRLLTQLEGPDGIIKLWCLNCNTSR